MTQSTATESSYFTLNNPSLNNKPQPTTNNATTKSGLLNRRQQHASYLPQLELPSLPPLSQLLTTENNNRVKKENTNPQQLQQNDAAVAAAVAAGIIPTYPPQQNPIYAYNNNTTNTNTTTTIPTTVNTTTMAQLMDPIPVAAPTGTFNAMDSMYNLTAPTNADAAAMVAAAAYMNTMPPQQLQQQPRQRQLSSSSTSSAEKIYSFVAIPGTNQKKRPRRRYDEIERLYHCSWGGCTKAYGTLNHLNAHVSMQKHGPKRHPAEFKEMRKEWRRQKKEREARKKENQQVSMNQPFNTFNQPAQQQQFQPYGLSQQSVPPQMSLNAFY